MDLAGDIVQSLANYLGLEDLPSTAHFPTDTLKLENLIARYMRKNLIARYTGERISLTGIVGTTRRRTALMTNSGNSH